MTDDDVGEVLRDLLRVARAQGPATQAVVFEVIRDYVLLRALDTSLSELNWQDIN